MEERMIDDEYGRGVRLKKTKEGYIDVTEENLAPQETEDEVAFEFPVFETDEDDEELVGLTPEQAVQLRKRRAEEEAARKAEYEKTCKEGEELLALGSYKSAELKFENALALDEEATEASVGYWRAKTSDFTEPDVLIDEYAEAGVESLEFDLGYKAVDIIKRDYQAVFQRRVAELTAEEQPLAQEVESKREARREIISARLKRSTIAFVASVVPAVALLVLTIVFGLKNFTTRDNTFVLPTVLFGVGFFCAFIAFMVFTNKWLNDFRMRRMNERLRSTEEGARLAQIREYKELYECLLPNATTDE